MSGVFTIAAINALQNEIMMAEMRLNNATTNAAIGEMARQQNLNNNLYQQLDFVQQQNGFLQRKVEELKQGLSKEEVMHRRSIEMFKEAVAQMMGEIERLNHQVIVQQKEIALRTHAMEEMERIGCRLAEHIQGDKTNG